MGALGRFLPSLLPGLQALANPWVLLALIAGGAACFTAGWKVESWRWDASLTAVAEATVESLVAFHQNQREINAGISADLAKGRQKLAVDRRHFEEKLRNVPKTELVETECPPQLAGDPAPAVAAAGAPTPASGGVVRLSRIAVSLWNDGLATGLPETYGAWRTDADAGAAGPAEIYAAIANTGENGAVCNVLRTRLLGWQAWARKNALTP